MLVQLDEMLLNTQSTMLTGFLSRAKISGSRPTGLLRSMTVAEKYTKELKATEDAGRACRRKAAWIGLLRYAM
jgi:hypothetical protein